MSRARWHSHAFQLVTVVKLLIVSSNITSQGAMRNCQLDLARGDLAFYVEDVFTRRIASSPVQL